QSSSSFHRHERGAVITRVAASEELNLSGPPGYPGSPQAPASHARTMCPIAGAQPQPAKARVRRRRRRRTSHRGSPRAAAMIVVQRQIANRKSEVPTASKAGQRLKPVKDDLLRLGGEMVVVVEFLELDRIFGGEQFVGPGGVLNAIPDVLERRLS